MQNTKSDMHEIWSLIVSSVRCLRCLFRY